MSTWYKTSSFASARIEPVEVIRSTAKQVVYLDAFFKRERKANKTGDYANYFETWNAAQAFLIERASAEVTSARRRLELANSALGNIKGLKKPEGA